MKIVYGWRTECNHFSMVTKDDTIETLIDVIETLKNDFEISVLESDYKFFSDEFGKRIELSYEPEDVGYTCYISLYKDILMDINGTLVVLPYWSYNER